MSPWQSTPSRTPCPKIQANSHRGRAIRRLPVNGAAVPALGTGYRRIFTLKQRELTQTVAWLVDGVEALDRYGVDIPEDARVLARRCWPGALTIVVKAAPCVPTFMRAADDTVPCALRPLPWSKRSSAPAAALLPAPAPIRMARPAPASFADVEDRILEGVDLAVDAGETPCRDASTIVTFKPWRASDPAPRRTSRIRDRTGPVRPDAIERCKRCR